LFLCVSVLHHPLPESILGGVCTHARMHVHWLHCGLITHRDTLTAPQGVPPTSGGAPSLRVGDYGLTCLVYALMCLYVTHMNDAVFVISTMYTVSCMW